MIIKEILSIFLCLTSMLCYNFLFSATRKKMSVFEFEELLVIEKINFSCKNNNTLHVFLEISYQSYQDPWCVDEEPHGPSWCDGGCKKHNFLKTVIEEMKKDIPIEQKKVSFYNALFKISNSI